VFWVDGDGDDDETLRGVKRLRRPAGGSRCVEIMAPGTCFSSRRAMFDAISV
jgi:hypothetical protein